MMILQETPLVEASRWGDMDVGKIIVERGANVNRVSTTMCFDHACVGHR